MTVKPSNCPEGHGYEKIGDDTYYCEPCDRTVKYNPVNKSWILVKK